MPGLLVMPGLPATPGLLARLGPAVAQFGKPMLARLVAAVAVATGCCLA